MKANAILLALSIAGAGSAGAVLIAGGGPPKSDCFVELDVKGGSQLGIRGVECTDGDPACDFDGACDGNCRFDVAVCLNQRDPDVPNCTAPFPPSALLRASERGLGQAGLSFPSFASSACGAFVGVDTPVLKARRRPGRRIKTLAVSPTRPKRDVDLVKLFCRPRVGTCPVTTTTTTTTNPTDTSVTTTTLPVTAFTATADTGIFSGNPDATLGSTNQVFVGNDASNSQRALLRFDLTSIPPTATIASCTLTVDIVTRNQASAGKIYRVKQPAWSETTATWNRYDGVSAWTTPGAFDAVELASDVVVTPGPDGPVAYAPPTGSEAFTFPDIRGLCQDAVTNRSGALDLMIKQDDDAPGPTAEMGFSRHTDNDPDERPMLAVGLAP
jgi:hypothetical protein